MANTSFKTLIQILGLVTCLGLWTQPVQGGKPQNLSQPPQDPIKSKPSPQAKPELPSSQKPQPRLKTLVDSLLKRLRRQERPLGSRGPLCAIAPGLLGQTDTIWSDRPLFLWQGETDRIVLRHEATNEMVWQKTVPPNSRQLTYTGNTLQPGQVYIWEAMHVSEPQRRFTFMVMPEPERQQLMAQWQATNLERQDMQVKRAIAALRLADYFGQRGLWSDALQTLYTIENPPLEMVHAFEQISSYLCDGTDLIVEGEPQSLSAPHASSSINSLPESASRP